jgi:hypothetical protein
MKRKLISVGMLSLCAMSYFMQEHDNANIISAVVYACLIQAVPIWCVYKSSPFWSMIIGVILSVLLVVEQYFDGAQGFIILGVFLYWIAAEKGFGFTKPLTRASARFDQAIKN